MLSVMSGVERPSYDPPAILPSYDPPAILPGYDLLAYFAQALSARRDA